MGSTKEELLAIIEDKVFSLNKTGVNLKKTSKQRLTKGYIETKLESVKKDWNIIQEAHIDLVKCVSKEEKKTLSYFSKNQYYEFEEIFVNLQADFKDLLTQLIASSESPQISKHCQNSNGDSLIKLPSIQLPTFSGLYEEWPAYRDMFTALVHDNKTISNVQKMHYLKASLSGEPQTLLRHIQITEANYEQAWSMLKNRYGMKRMIVNSLMKRLFNQKKMTAKSSNQIKSLLDTTTECLHSIENLNISTASWDPFIIFLLVQKLDPETHQEWEENSYKDESDELPNWNELRKFLESKFRTLELVGSGKPISNVNKVREFAVHVSTTPTADKGCPLCNESHTLCHCKEFTLMSPTDRSDYIIKNNRCFNCLAPGHSAWKCRLRVSCRLCHRRHHTLVHETAKKSSASQPDNIESHFTEVDEQDEEQSESTSNVELATLFATTSSTALLSTAIIKVKDDFGHTTILRALIDSGSQATLITERAVQALCLKKTAIQGTITGVGSTKTTVRHSAEVELLSYQDPSFNLRVKVYIIPTQLTKQLPSRSISTNTWPHLQGLVLADPNFHQPGRVDMLLGVDVCSQIMKSEFIKGPPGTPCAQHTSLGWILFGAIQNEIEEDIIQVMHANLDLDYMLKAMWEQTKDEKRKHTPEENKCEEIYETTTTRSIEGRYIVNLPKKSEMLLCTQGRTREIAMKRLVQLERRLEKSTELQTEYAKVMQEYIDLKHMEEVPCNEKEKPAVYLPHHAVVKEDKETSKVRVVFNASQKGYNNVSLNDELLVGPTLQEDIRSLIMRWRMKRICYVTDIQKMYRQIEVNTEDQDLQRILWRNKTCEPVKDFRMKRVTFGTASAPYLAVKTLQRLAKEEGQLYIEASRVIIQDCFMDDIMSGNDTPEEAIKVAKDVQAILLKGGFILQKWCSNNTEFLKHFTPEERSTHVNLDIKLDGTIRALGLQWNMGKDYFQYELKLPPVNKTITKRIILADIQRLFDPLGWLAPPILQAKLLIQSLWFEGISWDEEVNENIAKRWIDMRDSFIYLPNIKIKRWLHTSEKEINNISIHGFCDASERAYAAVAYIRVETGASEIKTNIVAAKTRVAPIKPLSLPRLELCGAVLLAGLLKQIKEAMRISASQVYAWTDSTIVLSWLSGNPARWNTYVRNRVVEVLDNIGNTNWYHVISNENPADVASRGEPLQNLQENEMWWQGPKWLRDDKIQYRRPEHCHTDLEKKVNIQVNINIHTETKESSLTKKFKEFESLTELLTTLVYCHRFLRYKKFKDPVPISTIEIDEALKKCIRIVQRDNFDEEIQQIKQKRNLGKGSKLKTLQPYLDQNDILRVGGRLHHSDFLEEAKHPIILTSDDSLTKLIVSNAHKKTLHGGCQLMLGYLRTKYWIIKAKKIVKQVLHNCLICAKHNAYSRAQLMGDLPRVRVTPARAFLHAGVDFAGPYSILMSRGRGAKTSKAYIALFICMSTKAIHLELVGNLTSEAFIGAFRRFVARRGRCTDLWSDQGKNFVGANRELSETLTDIKSKFEVEIAELLALDGTQWHFIPAYSPHMGGLWEAGVKSFKHHLKRILTSHVTYEEMTTLLCQIEACLNSRPLSPMEEADATEPQPLTPGHFLIGESPITVPTPELKDIKISNLSRWQFLQKLLVNFWNRWQHEYLSRMQQRPIWLKKVSEFEVGSIVLIKTDNLPPGKWLMGRIVEKHPGSDGVTRVYSVLRDGNIVKRSANKLCALPIDIN